MKIVTKEERERAHAIEKKLGFTLKEYNEESMKNLEDAHERDNEPNPFDILTMDEVLFIMDNREAFE
jgi:hypothetical protein